MNALADDAIKEADPEIVLRMANGFNALAEGCTHLEILVALGLVVGAEIRDLSGDNAVLFPFVLIELAKRYPTDEGAA
jgi:hypothetical protein